MVEAALCSACACAPGRALVGAWHHVYANVAQRMNCTLILQALTKRAQSRILAENVHAH
jgi:hypothetical protein